MEWWAWFLLGTAVLLTPFAVVAGLLALDPRVRLLVRALSMLGWRRSARGFWRMLHDRRVSRYARLLPVLLLAYLLSPVDLVPDLVPLLGVVDDAMALGFTAWLVARLIPRRVLEEHLRGRGTGRSGPAA